MSRFNRRPTRRFSRLLDGIGAALITLGALALGMLPAVAYLVIGAILFGYNMWAYFGLQLPWYLNAVGGVIAPLNFVFAFIAYIIINFTHHAAPIIH